MNIRAFMMTADNAGSKVGEISASCSTTTAPSAKRRKLTGRAFYESLGSPKFVLAPMVDQSEIVRFSSSFAIWNAVEIFI